MDILVALLVGIWSTLVAMAPWLLFGFLAAGVLSLSFSPERVQSFLGRKAGCKAIWLAVLIGVPLPLCSCGVLPAAVGLRKSGASKGATAAFLISTPQTGLDSFFATGSLLGWAYALTRPLVAILTGLIGGHLVDLYDQEPLPMAVTAKSLSMAQRGIYSKLQAVVVYGFGMLLGNVTLPLIIGIVLSACITVFVPETLFTANTLGNDWIAFPLMLVVGIPMYVCSTASIPVALSLMAKGLSPGAALIFLIVGPALNGASLTTLLRLLGKTCLFIHLTVLSSIAVIAAFLLNFIQSLWQILPQYHATTPACTKCVETSFISIISAILLVMLICYHLMKRFMKGPSSMTTSSGQILTIKGMMCDHCRGAAKRLLESYPTVTSVEQVAPNAFSVQGLLPETLAKDIEDLGFTLVDQQ